jgi:sirohydrochlorin ferrochelatase
MKTAVIILFHGSRSDRAGGPVEKIIASVRERGGYHLVERAFLQHAEPDLPSAVERAVAQGAGRIVVVPFFMQTGAHVTADIPDAVRNIRQRHPGLELEVTAAVGTHDLMTEIVVDLVGKSIVGRQARSAE